jgi:hypothetical protein
MQRLALSGNLADPVNIRLDKPVLALKGRVRVTLEPEDGHRTGRKSLSDWLESRPAGKRTKEDIDRQIAEERDSWGER